MTKNEFVYNIKDLVYSIEFKHKLVIIDMVRKVEELKYFINWLKDNFVVLGIEDSKRNKINIESLKDKDLYDEDSYTQLDTSIIIHKNSQNNFLTLEIRFKEELECWDDDGVIEGSFDTIFEEAMFLETRKDRTKLTDYIIKNICGQRKAITVKDEEECKDFIKYLYDNFYINDIMLPEKHAGTLNNRKTIVKDFITYCKYKDYKIALELDGGNDINVWGLIDDFNNIPEDIKLIEWSKLKTIVVK